MATVDEALAALHALAKPDQLAGMARYGMAVNNRLGIKIPELRRLARQTGRDHALALALWDTAIAEARILASMVDEPDAVTAEQMDAWVQDLDSWDVCDQVCMNLFDKTPLAWERVHEWAERDEEYVKRAAYALIACLAWHDNTAEDARFLALMPLIVQGATDDRNYVKKAVSWALRHIGKRNAVLHDAVLATAADLRTMDSKSARWIGKDAVRDLNSEATQTRLQKQAAKNAQV
jgi:3-methyladenine DNA glycosylase AlkD